LGRRVSIPVLLALVGALAAAYVVQALNSRIEFDEPMWFQRSLVTPANLSTPAYRHWAEDIPGLNRWVYFAALKVTGLDKTPADAEPCWSLENGIVHLNDMSTGVDLVKDGYATLADWEAKHGRYAPRDSIMAMRFVDIGVFLACLACMWWTARMILKSDWLAAFSVLPLVLSPVFSEDVSYVINSGDGFLAGGLAATLAGWTYFHLKGHGTSRWAILAVGALAGLATASKQTGVLAVVAFAAYLAWQSRGRERLVNPLMACAAAFIVFSAINWDVFFTPGQWPWNVLATMVANRAQIVVHHYGGKPFSPLEAFKFFWWPLLPLALYCLWVSRRERWFPAVGLWSIVIIVGTLAGMTGIRISAPRYLAPLEMAMYFPVSVVMLSLARRANHGCEGQKA
jgi:hypothetical protein